MRHKKYKHADTLMSVLQLLKIIWYGSVYLCSLGLSVFIFCCANFEIACQVYFIGYQLSWKTSLRGRRSVGQ